MTVRIKHGNRCVSAEADCGERMYDVLLRAGADGFDAPCGGAGICGKCWVKIDGKRERACLYRICGDCEVELNGETDAKAPLSDVIVKDGGDKKKYGLACDIGTTTVAMSLCRLSDGKTVAGQSFMNPLRAYGADIISRLKFAAENENGAEILHGVLINRMRAAMEQLCAKAGADTDEIEAAAAAGNTVMQHIFAGEELRGLAAYPFEPASLFGETREIKGFGIRAPVYLPPCFSAFVGGDISAGAAAAELDRTEGGVLFADIGTNGEMCLKTDAFPGGGACSDMSCTDKNARYEVCSVAAGPAFEGAGIECGTAGIPGAVNRVAIGKDGIEICTIGNCAPVGICGSGIISAAACLLKMGIVDESGKMSGRFYLDKEHEIYVSPADIRQLQLAKAAFAAGIELLSRRAPNGTKLMLSGGFGSFIDAGCAAEIGLIPAAKKDKTQILGNTSLIGAQRLITEDGFADRVEEIVRNASVLELAGDPEFCESYVEHMTLCEF
ncbi:MAG: ASKHA domain-containing protein [Firmicutes bacterium]|nr:ASKHA domain-containing protein [Bacillota bacterium]